jgi:hypothetical protein
MARNEKKKQQKVMKQRRKAKQKKKRIAAATGGSSEKAAIRRADSYPLHECLMNRDWTESGMAVVLVARRQKESQVMAGIFMTDCYCLGVKEAMCRANVPEIRYEEDIRAHVIEQYDARPVPFERACQIIYGAADYAADLGFRPHKDYRLACHILLPRDAVPPADDLEFGKDGKPFYMAGPHDNPKKILKQLKDRLGPDGFHFIAGLDMPGGGSAF